MSKVSVIVPCYNEEATIRLLLDALRAQTFPIENMEIIIADGLSQDRTRDEIAAFQSQHPEMHVRIVDNPKRNIPSALNRALEAAGGEYIIRLDAHAVPAVDYIERCVRSLEEGAGENVGGMWEIAPGGPGAMARAIAYAASHPLAVGDAQYRVGKQARYVHTVPFGAFRRDLVDEIGFYDETLLTNEDYEFNTRILKSGRRVWFDPAIRSKYFARPDFGALLRQYLRYGFWKGKMLRRYPETLRWRQLLPPLFVSGLLGLLVLSIFIPFVRLVLGGVILIYFGVLFVIGGSASIRRSDPALVLGVPLAIATMHLSWGSALLWSLVWWK